MYIVKFVPVEKLYDSWNEILTNSDSKKDEKNMRNFAWATKTLMGTSLLSDRKMFAEYFYANFFNFEHVILNDAQSTEQMKFNLSKQPICCLYEEFYISWKNAPLRNKEGLFNICQ